MRRFSNKFILEHICNNSEPLTFRTVSCRAANLICHAVLGCLTFDMVSPSSAEGTFLVAQFTCYYTFSNTEKETVLPSSPHMRWRRGHKTRVLTTPQSHAVNPITPTRLSPQSVYTLCKLTHRKSLTTGFWTPTHLSNTTTHRQIKRVWVSVVTLTAQEKCFTFCEHWTQADLLLCWH